MNDSLPTISIVTINLNGGATLERAIKSILGQNYPTLEYIVIDGGSTDDSLHILHRYRERIDVLISEPDRGISDAFNKGISHASGDIIGLISADDVLEEGVLRVIGLFYRKKGRPTSYMATPITRRGSGWSGSDPTPWRNSGGICR